MGDSAVFSLRLGDIVEAIGGELLGAAQIAVEGLAPLDRAQPHQICFLSNPRYAAALPDRRLRLCMTLPIAPFGP